MRKLRVLCCKLAMAALAALLSASVSATTLARQSGAFGIVTCDSIPVPPVTPTGILARQCGAFGIVTYDLPSVTETQTTPVPVPYEWLRVHDPDVVDEYESYETAAKATAANGRNKVWECFVAGISPTNETARFTAKIEMRDGVPVVTWEPDLNTNGVVRTYKVYGRETLENGGSWQYPTNSLHRFFKVTVEMP